MWHSVTHKRHSGTQSSKQPRQLVRICVPRKSTRRRSRRRIWQPGSASVRLGRCTAVELLLFLVLLLRRQSANKITTNSKKRSFNCGKPQTESTSGYPNTRQADEPQTVEWARSGVRGASEFHRQLKSSLVLFRARQAGCLHQLTRSHNDGSLK